MSNIMTWGLQTSNLEHFGYRLNKMALFCSQA